MDIRVLEYFLVTAQEENITKAAQRLHLTQPTLSRQLKQLEDELGTILFQRTNHSVLLTNEGILFRRRAQDIVALTEKARSEVAHNKHEWTGIISIGCGELRAVRELAVWINRFQERFPLVKFDLFSGSSEEIQVKMEEGSLDLGLFLMPFYRSQYTSLRMQTEERWGVLLHEEHPLTSQKAIRPGDLIGTKVVTIHIDTPVHAELAKWSGESASKMDFSTNYNVLSNAAVIAREQKGAVICLEPDCSYESMYFLPLEPELKVGSVLAWKEISCSKLTKAFLEFIKE
ncbi:LysR family transcriptional regulator [Holdemania filiformis]|uniref:LysR family transcriptional regulator n=1 Tax=Holdemania filiformis TaxID=61171 RepID=UPI00266F358C|nr:LysR family transcriptional regulator [Holdemania filiformis]